MSLSDVRLSCKRVSSSMHQEYVTVHGEWYAASRDTFRNKIVLVVVHGEVALSHVEEADKILYLRSSVFH